MKRILGLFAVLIMSVFLLCECSSYNLEIYGNISGKITDASTGNPLPLAQVTLIPGANTVQTSIDGTFSFTRLEEGQYTVSVQKEGFQANRKNIKVVSGETTEIIVTLTKIHFN